jgi:hypothetical protein
MTEIRTEHIPNACLDLYLHTNPFGMQPVNLWVLLPAKGKAIPVTGRGGPRDCETSRLPHFLNYRFTDGGDVLALCAGRP